MSGPITVAPANGTQPDPAAPDVPPGSILARLREDAAKARERRTLDLPVGGAFGDRLVIRYRGLSVEEVERYGDLADTVGQLSLSIDLMVHAAETVLYTEDANTTDLGVGLGQGLWDVLGWPLPAGVDELTPREVVDGLWYERGLALGTHLARLAEFQTGEAVVPGESLGSTS